MSKNCLWVACLFGSWCLSLASKPAHAWIELSSNAEQTLRAYHDQRFPHHAWKRDNAPHSCLKLRSSSGFGDDLMTQETFETFELEFEWSFENHNLKTKRANSGVLFAVQPGAEYSYMTGPEIQLLNVEPHTRSQTILMGLGALYDLSPPWMNATELLVPTPEFNKTRILVTPEHAQVYMNDVLIAEHSLDVDIIQSQIAGSKFREYPEFYKIRRGHVLFQDHGAEMTLCNARIREL